MPSNGTLISDGGAFVLGFFSPKTSSGDLYLGVWYNLPQRTVIWVANREKPIGDPSATLLFSNDSNLLLVDSKESTFWSSNYSSSGDGAVAVLLLNTGNLVLREGNNNVLWQSFDHPTDTFMPGMNLRFPYGHRSSTLFASWKDADDPSPGNFICGIDANTSLQLMTWRGSEIYSRSQVWAGSFFSGSLGLTPNSVLYLTMTVDEHGLLLTMTVSDSSLYTRYTLNHSGQLQLLSWNSESQFWQIYTSTPTSCEVYGFCGQFAYCDANEPVPVCKCLEGFEPKSKSAWDGGNYLDGCSRTTALRCGEGDDFLKVTRMKLPDKFRFVRNKNMSECRSECMANCSCTAYAYAYTNLTAGNETVPRCLVWMENMIDAELLNGGGEDLHLRLMNLNSGRICASLSLQVDFQHEKIVIIL